MLILKCEAFDSEPSGTKRNVCCPECHSKGTMINVVPWRAGSTPSNKSVDWELNIQGFVCCGRFDFVRSLSREWWVRKLAEAAGWDERKIADLLSYGSWHPLMERKATGRRSSTTTSTEPEYKAVVGKPNIPSGKCMFCGKPAEEMTCPDCLR